MNKIEEAEMMNRLRKIIADMPKWRHPKRTRCLTCRRVTDTDGKGRCGSCGFRKTGF